MEKIKASFKDYFQSSEIELPEPIPAQGSLNADGWFIRYVLTEDDDHQVCLDFYADHRMTNPRHIRISRSGAVIALACFLESYSYDPEIEGDKEAAKQRFQDHNERVSRTLRQKGLI